MKFWKEHQKLRIFLIAAFFAIGTALVLYGWSLTGQLSGVIIMLVGVVFLLAALLIYNKPFEEPKAKKS